VNEDDDDDEEEEEDEDEEDDEHSDDDEEEEEAGKGEGRKRSLEKGEEPWSVLLLTEEFADGLEL